MTVRSAFDGDARIMLCESMQRFAREGSEDATNRAWHAWQSIAAQGWLGLGLPESAGGYGAFIGDLGLLLSIAGAARWRLPLVECLGEACGALLAAPPGAERDELLGKIAAAEAVVLMAASHLDPGNVATSAAASNGIWHLAGRTQRVRAADLCTHLLVEARDAADSERGLYLIERGAARVTVECGVTVDGQSATLFDLQDIPALRIGDALAIDAGRRRAQLLVACESLAIAQAVLDATKQHLAGRNQFGQPILRFQAVQHRLVEIYLRIRELRALLATAEAAYDEDDPKLDRLLWQLQAQASATAITATQEGIQLHGAMGMTAEMPLGDYYKRVLLLQSSFGSYELALDRLADTLDFQREVA
jgi:alkylation response protein AidB-like acyl-CoA dehydrogenase